VHCVASSYGISVRSSVALSGLSRTSCKHYAIEELLRVLEGLLSGAVFERACVGICSSEGAP
jgi:hypothetical protein